MQVRSPAAVDLGAADGCQPLSLEDGIPNFQCRQRFPVQVTIQRVEGLAASGLMLKYDDRTVILRGGIVSKREDRPVQRSIDGCACLGEQVNSEMDGAGFVGRTAAGGESRRGVQVARLVVLPDRDISRLSVS